MRAGEAHKDGRYADTVGRTRAIALVGKAQQHDRVARLSPHHARLHHGREARPPRPITRLATAARSPSSPDPRACCFQLAALGWPHRCLTPSFADAALHFRSAPLHTFHSAVRKRRRQARTEGLGGVSMASSASATCASETVPTRSLASLTAAPKVCLPTGSSRRVAPPGSVPCLPRCLRRHPVGSPRTAEWRGPSNAAADCALSATATMLLRARLGLHCNRTDCHRVDEIGLTTGAPCCTLGLPACPATPQATARRSTRPPGVRAALRWRQAGRTAADQLHCASGMAQRGVARKRFSFVRGWPGHLLPER